MPITTRQKLGSKFGMVHRAIAGVFILAVFASASVTSDRSLQCVARLAGEPGRDCFAAGLVSPGEALSCGEARVGRCGVAHC